MCQNDTKNRGRSRFTLTYLLTYSNSFEQRSGEKNNTLNNLAIKKFTDLLLHSQPAVSTLISNTSEPKNWSINIKWRTLYNMILFFIMQYRKVDKIYSCRGDSTPVRDHLEYLNPSKYNFNNMRHEMTLRKCCWWTNYKI